MSAPRPSRTTPPRRRLVVVSALTAAVVVAGGVGLWWHADHRPDHGSGGPVPLSEPGTLRPDASAGSAPGNALLPGGVPSSEPDHEPVTGAAQDGDPGTPTDGATATCTDATDGSTTDGSTADGDRCAERAASPLDPWWRRALPVDGTFVPIERGVSGTVSISSLSGQLVIKVHHLDVQTADDESEDVMVVLSAGDVIGKEHGFWSVGDASPIIIGTIPGGETDITMILDVPSTLPAEVHSIVLLGGGSKEQTDFGSSSKIIGGAELLPSV
jgi:hypothetical protein